MQQIAKEIEEGLEVVSCRPHEDTREKKHSCPIDNGAIHDLHDVG